MVTEKSPKIISFFSVSSQKATNGRQEEAHQKLSHPPEPELLEKI
jgi:hypothetical protein